MKTLTIQITASTVAWYGAITATLALGIELVKLWLERRRVKLKIRPCMTCSGQIFPNEPAGSDYILFDLINQGKRPVTITHHGIKMKGKKKFNHLYIAPNFADLPGALPKEILDGQSYSVYANFETVKQKTNDFNDIDYFLVSDATGKTHKRKMDGKFLKVFKSHIQST